MHNRTHRSLRCDNCSAFLRYSREVKGVIDCEYCGVEHRVDGSRAERDYELNTLGDIFDPLGLFH
jgi:ribosomal protein L37AE/L43A